LIALSIVVPIVVPIDLSIALLIDLLTARGAPGSRSRGGDCPVRECSS